MPITYACVGCSSSVRSRPAPRIQISQPSQVRQRGAARGEKLVWSAAERQCLDMLVRDIDRRAGLRRRYNNTEDSKAAVKLSCELRQPDTAIMRLMASINTHVAASTCAEVPAKSHDRLLDSEGRLFSPNLHAIGPENDQVDINPGNFSQVYLGFDVPKGTTPSQYVLLLHASPDSASVTIRLPDSL